MNYRRLALVMFISPLASVLVTGKLVTWLVGANELLDVDPLSHKLWILVLVATVIFLVARIAHWWSVMTCCLLGIFVVLSVDVFEIVKLIGDYQKSSENNWFLVAANLLAKLAGGIVLGFFSGLWIHFVTHVPKGSPDRIVTMMSTAISKEFRRTLPGDCAAILKLQSANYIANLSEEERKTGFLSAEFTPEQTAQIAEFLARFAATINNRLVGFFGCFRKNYKLGPPFMERGRAFKDQR